MINWKEDIFLETNLSQAYRASRKFTPNRFNQAVRCLVFAVGSIIAGLWINDADWNGSYDALMKLSNLGFDLSVQILGFLIGGFAIFATVTDHKLMVPLASSPMKGENVSVFKYVFFNFISVFFIFLIVLSVSLSVSIIDSITSLSTTRNALVAAIVNSLTFVVALCLVCSAVLRLKSFIWNIYQAFLIFISVSDALSNSTGRPDNNPANDAGRS